MIVREYQPEDLGHLQRFHDAAGYGFEFPNIDAPLVESRKIVERSNGEILMGAVAVRTLELFLFCDHSQRPEMRMLGIGKLHAEMVPELMSKGYVEGNAFLPPELERYGAHLTRKFGWEKNWTTYRFRG